MGSDTSTLVKSGPGRLASNDRKAQPPDMFHVVLLNDDFTPMEFVMCLLQQFFGHSSEEAETITLRIHEKGRGICGTYTRDIATTKAEQVKSHAQGHKHPLNCTVEPE